MVQRWLVREYLLTPSFILGWIDVAPKNQRDLVFFNILKVNWKSIEECGESNDQHDQPPFSWTQLMWSSPMTLPAETVRVPGFPRRPAASPQPRPANRPLPIRWRRLIEGLKEGYGRFKDVHRMMVQWSSMRFNEVLKASEWLLIEGYVHGGGCTQSLPIDPIARPPFRAQETVASIFAVSSCAWPQRSWNLRWRNQSLKWTQWWDSVNMDGC